MWKITTLSALLVGLALASGCKFKADASNMTIGGPAPARQAPPNPADDWRTLSQLRLVNGELRQSISQRERQRQSWEIEIRSKKHEIDILKDQRDDLKKQRDRAKKAAEHDD